MLFRSDKRAFVVRPREGWVSAGKHGPKVAKGMPKAGEKWKSKEHGLALVTSLTGTMVDYQAAGRNKVAALGWFLKNFKRAN